MAGGSVGRVGVDTPADMLRASLDPALQWDLDGAVSLALKNIAPNFCWTEFGDDGEPDSYNLRAGMPEDIVAHHINISRPGKPQRRHLHRQSTAPVEVENGTFEMQQPWVGGVFATDGEDSRKPEAPRVEKASADTRGFPAGTYGYAWGLEGDGLTTFTAFRYFELANNQRPAIPVPESFPAGTERWVIAMTRRGGGPETAAIQRRIPLSALRGREEVFVSGPRDSKGEIPATNESGFGSPARPRRGRDVRVRHKPGRDLRAGTYRLFLQLKNNRGTSLLSEASRPIVVTGDEESKYTFRSVSQATPVEPAGEDEVAGPDEKVVTYRDKEYVIARDSELYHRDGKVYEITSGQRADVFEGFVFIVASNEVVVRREGRVQARAAEKVQRGVKRNAGIFCRAPRIVRQRPGGEGLRYTYWILFEPEQAGEGESGPVFYRAYPRYRRTGAAGYFGGEDGSGVWVHGYAPDSEPKGLYHGLVQEEPPTEDTTIIEPPDPTTVPDEATPSGTETPPAGKYLVSVTGVTRSGALTQVSEPTEVTLGAGEIMQITPRPLGAVNLLANAEFTRLEANGRPRNWALANVGANDTGAFDVADGVLTLRTTQSTATQISAESRPIPASSDSVFTVGGDLEVRQYISGEARVVLRQYQGATLLRSTNAATLTQNGALPFSQRFSGADLPTGHDLHPDTDNVTLFIVLPGTVTNNLRALVSNLRVLGLGTDIRKVDFTPKPNSFDVSPAVPVRGGSYIAYGPAPQVSGRIVEAEPPLEIVDFESGHWPASWTHNTVGTVTTNERSTAAALHGSYGWRLADNDNARSQRYYTKPFTADTRKKANRFLVRVDRLPTRGIVALGFVASGSQTLASVRVDSEGRLSVSCYYPNGDRYNANNIAWNVRAGTTLDLEITVTGGRSSNGIVTVGVGRNGSHRVVAFEQGGFDYRGYSVDTPGIGVHYVTESSARWTLSYDQVVITENGDVLDREAPAPPSGYTPPPPDVPVGADGLYRELDPDGQKINQGYTVIEPGATDDEPRTLPLGEYAVKPGASYTAGIYARWFSFTDKDSYLRATLEGEGEEPLRVVDIPMSDANSWRELWDTFEVPDYLPGEPLYTSVRVELVLESGIFVPQELLLHEGLLGTHAERDAARTYDRARGPASIEAVLPAEPPARWTLHGAGGSWSDFGIREATDVTLDSEGVTMNAVTLSREYATSKDNASFTPLVADSALVTPDEPYLKLRATLTGDGRYSPIIAPGGMYLQTWHPLSTLMRADGSHFPGVAIMGNIHYGLSYPDSEVARVGGHHQTVETTEDIGRLYGLRIMAFSEDAAREIEEDSLREDFVVEAPVVGNSAEGMRFTIRMREQARFETENLAPRIIEDLGERYTGLFAIAEIEEAEILESAPLAGPISWEVRREG